MAAPDFDPSGDKYPVRTENTQMNFFERIFSFLFGGDDPEREKRRLLKQIEKDLKSNKARFYKPKSEEALSNMARFIFDMYKIVGPAQSIVQHAESSNALKSIVIDSYLNDSEREMQTKMTEDYIRERSTQVDTKQLADEMKDQLISFFSLFSNEIVQKINHTFSDIKLFLDIVHFDYYFFLKKFDSTLVEGSFSGNPKFDSISGEYVVEDLKDLIEILGSLDAETDWDQVFDVIKEYRGVEVVARNPWKKMVKRMLDLKKSGLLIQIVRHLEKDPQLQIESRRSLERIVDPFLSKLKTQTEVTIQKIIQERRNNKIENLVKAIFGTTIIARTKHYTEKANIMFSKKMMGGFTYIVPINYLKAFLLDFYKKDVRELMDILLVRGNWTTNLMSQQLSEAYHAVMNVSESLMKFDDALAEEGELGIKLKQYVSKADKEKGSMKFLRQLLQEINESARKMINESASNLITIGKGLKNVIEDSEKQHHEFLINWKEIESSAGGNLREHMIEVYKKLYYFVQLMQIYSKKESS